jgi:hypothetical protein
VMAAAGGRPRPLVERVSFAAFPTFSPDGARVAFTGWWGSTDRAGRDTRIYVVEVGAPGRRGGGAAPEEIVPDLDRPVGFTWASPPLAWLSPDELLFTCADRGAVGIRRARLGERTGRVVVGGDTQVAGLSVAGPAGRQVIAYAASWVDAPGEVFCTAVSPRRRAPAPARSCSPPCGCCRRSVSRRRLPTGSRSSTWRCASPPAAAVGGAPPRR